MSDVSAAESLDRDLRRAELRQGTDRRLSAEVAALRGAIERQTLAINRQADAIDLLVAFANRTDATLAKVRAVVKESIPAAIRIAQSLKAD